MSKKTAALHSKEERKHGSAAGRARRVSPEQAQVDAILADAKIDGRSRKFFAHAAVRYSDLMKRLADK